MRILLVRLRLIGDVAFTTPLIRALRRRWPDAHLSYVVEPSAAPILRDNPHLDDLIVAPRRRGVTRVIDDLRLARRLRAARFDVAIDLHGGPRAAWLTWASRAPVRVGYTIKGRRWMYTHVVDRAPDLGPRHSVLNQWDLLTPLGIGPPDRARDAVEIIPDPDAIAAVSQRLHELDIHPEHDLIVIHVSAGNPFRRWPAESFVQLVVGLASGDPNRRILLTSGPSERAAAQAVAATARQRLGRAFQVPDTADFSLAELRALVDRAAVYIGGDSGPLHVASATTTPIVALFGPTLAERSMPWRDARWFAEAVDAGALPCRPCTQRECVPGDFRCLTGITPRQVIEAAERGIAFVNVRSRLHPSTAARGALSNVEGQPAQGPPKGGPHE
jgi:lipopolysaccharide heptosyltransferase II